MARLAAAALLLLAACGASAASHQQAPEPSPHPTAQLEALFADVWKLLSTESLFPQPLPGGTVSKLLDQQHGTMSGSAVPPVAAPGQKPAPPERPAAQWVAVERTQADAWDLLRRAQAAEAGPAAAVAATLPARLYLREPFVHGNSDSAGAAPLLPAHPKLALTWLFERNETSFDGISRSLGNTTFLSMGFSKTRLLRRLPGGGMEEQWELRFTFSVSVLGLACFALGMLCLALFPCLSWEDEDFGCDDCGCSCQCSVCSCASCQECGCGNKGEAAAGCICCRDDIKAAGYSKL